MNVQSIFCSAYEKTQLEHVGCASKHVGCALFAFEYSIIGICYIYFVRPVAMAIGYYAIDVKHNKYLMVQFKKVHKSGWFDQTIARLTIHRSILPI